MVFVNISHAFLYQGATLSPLTVGGLAFHPLLGFGLSYMKEGSSSINTTSVTAYKGNSSLIGYTTTKGATLAFTCSLALSLTDKGIWVNSNKRKMREMGLSSHICTHKQVEWKGIPHLSSFILRFLYSCCKALKRSIKVNKNVSPRPSLGQGSSIQF